MKTTVGRTYRFRAAHSLPDFPEPWCFQHQHDYTVEVEAKGDTPTDDVDAWWEARLTQLSRADLNKNFQPSTVENIAGALLLEAGPLVLSVTVWEDKQRWGKAER